MDDIFDFLRQRNVPEDIIEALDHEKIDRTAVLEMTDAQLSAYLPSYGDRLALMGFCRRNANSTRKETLFQRLRDKLRRKNDQEEKGESERNPPKKTRKTMRKVELGWMNYDERDGIFKQVRTKRGGGTRKIDVCKDVVKEDLIRIARGLFFPCGRNAEGGIEEFEFDLMDFKQAVVSDDTTVGELYDDTGLTLLRFYLSSQRKTDSETHQSEEQERIEHQSPPSVGSASIPETTQEVKSLVVGDTPSLGSASIPEMTQEEVIHLDLVGEDTDFEGISYIDSDLHVECDTDDSNIVYVSGTISGDVEQDLDDTLPMLQQDMPTENNPMILIIHRGQVLRQLIGHFYNDQLMNADVQIQFVLPDGTYEKGLDSGGVVRDCLSEFWGDFLEQCTTGNDLKVPFLRHDFGQMEWESVGRILAFGWERERYLPVKIAPAIIEQAAFGFTRSGVLENFLKYLPPSDRSLIDSWRSNGIEDENELIEVLSTYDCRKLPTAENANAILQELAHKTLIQEPAYVIEQWEKPLRRVKDSLKDLPAVYEALQPTAKKVLKLLHFPDTLDFSQKKIHNHLTCYVKNADTLHLCNFLRFCTGSDLFLGKTITVNFNQLQGLQRRPIAHTCGCVLQLSVHYDSYSDFSSEMNKVLKSNVWVMDIV
ncbi:hypothetical protein ACEWY4_025335 [Coilia grayii]|uniref:HECT domain-containing protein n=1 Tax=Coilia grayii TaxID=363190 RepID=A0ABD1IZ10_9TELE